MTQDYTGSQRELQDRFDTRRLADRLTEVSTDVLVGAHRAFVEARDMFFIATADDAGNPQVSYKGGDPGFVRVLDDRTLSFPVYNGNGMYLTAGNLAANPAVGLLFINWSDGSRLRVNGRASIDPDDPLTDTYDGAEMVVRVEVSEVFPNCRRYVHRYERVDSSPFVPREDGTPPVPDWKRDERFADTLPAEDPALDPDHPGAPSIPRF